MAAPTFVEAEYKPPPCHGLETREADGTLVGATTYTHTTRSNVVLWHGSDTYEGLGGPPRGRRRRQRQRRWQCTRARLAQWSSGRHRAASRGRRRRPGADPVGAAACQATNGAPWQRVLFPGRCSWRCSHPARRHTSLSIHQRPRRPCACFLKKSGRGRLAPLCLPGIPRARFFFTVTIFFAKRCQRHASPLPERTACCYEPS